jgi:hypothetical protein
VLFENRPKLLFGRGEGQVSYIEFLGQISSFPSRQVRTPHGRDIRSVPCRSIRRDPKRSESPLGSRGARRHEGSRGRGRPRIVIGLSSARYSVSISSFS